MSNLSLNELKIERDGLFKQLKDAYEGNKPEYMELKQRTDQLTNEINVRTAAEEANNGRKYDPALGVFVSISEDENKARIDRLKNYPDRKAGEEISSQERADKEWLVGVLKDPITGEQWYSNEQVKALSGGTVTVGTKELSEFLSKNNGNPPVSFAHLIVGPNDQNHFVSFDVRQNGDKTEITYFDTNGDLMLDAERAAIQKQHPGAVIKYINRDGNKISEAEAHNKPETLLKTQFDENTCGPRTAEAVNMMRDAGSDPEKFKAGIEFMKNIDPQSIRAEHSARLHEIARGIEQSLGIASVLSPDEKIRQTNYSQAVESTYNLQLTVNSQRATTEKTTAPIGEFTAKLNAARGIGTSVSVGGAE